MHELPVALLLVDGDENFRRAIAVALRLDGVQAREAIGVEQAGLLLEALRFETIVIDLLLPGARELASRLVGRGHVVVACSPHRESFAALPAEVATLEKPFSARDLLAAIPVCREAVG